MTVVQLVPSTATSAEGVVTTLENFLELAREGKIVSIGIAAVNIEGGTQTAYERGENFGTLVGAVERLKFRLVNDKAWE